MSDLVHGAQQAKESDDYQAFTDAFGARVRHIRKSRGWTLETAAEHCGLAWRHLQRIETGNVNVSLVTILRLCRGLEVEAAEFFRAEDTLRSSDGSEPNSDP